MAWSKKLWERLGLKSQPRKSETSIENWTLENRIFIDKDGPKTFFCLKGAAKNHPSYPNGCPIYTSPVLLLDILTGRAITKNRVYRLGTPKGDNDLEKAMEKDSKPDKDNGVEDCSSVDCGGCCSGKVGLGYVGPKTTPGFQGSKEGC
jgi:hypothetical protein